MKNKYISLLKLLGITAIIGGGTTLVALSTSCGKTLSDISSIIKTRNLGEIPNNSSAMIKERIEEANPKAGNIKWSQLQITAITDTSAFISATEDSSAYKGYIKVIFTVVPPDPEKVDLSSIISINDLQQITTNSEQAIQSKIVELNAAAANITWDQINITQISTTGARVEAKSTSTLYTGYVDVTFTLPPPVKTDISSIIQINALGDIASDTEQAIQSKVAELNTGAGTLVWNQIQISAITPSSAHIEAKTSSTLYTGYVDVTFNALTVSYNAQGTNWPGYTSGSLTCILNNINHTCVVSNGTSYVANGLIIPDTIVSNGMSYTVVGVDDSCFYNNTGLTGQLALGNNLATIGAMAFYGCTGLTGQLTFPNSITTIEHDAFNWCRNITGQLTLPSNPAYTTVSNASFAFMNYLTSVVMPANITTIENSAFSKSVGIAVLTCNFASAPTLGDENDCFLDLSVVGTVQNLNGAYSSANLCALFKTAGLPDGWTPYS